MALLVGYRAEVSEGGVDAATIVEALDVFEAGASSRSPDGPRLPVDEIGLEGSEKALCNGVVSAVAGPAETGADAVGMQDLGVALGGVLGLGLFPAREGPSVAGEGRASTVFGLDRVSRTVLPQVESGFRCNGVTDAGWRDSPWLLLVRSAMRAAANKEDAAR